MTAILIIDLQNEFLSSEGIFGDKHPKKELLIFNIMALLEYGRTCGYLICWIKAEYDHKIKLDYPSHYGVKPCCPKGSVLSEFCCEVKNQIKKDDVVLTKNYYSAFVKTGLDEKLKEKKIYNVVVCGLTLSNCITHTCLDAVKLGYHTTIVSDCVVVTKAKHMIDFVETTIKIIDVKHSYEIIRTPIEVLPLEKTYLINNTINNEEKVHDVPMLKETYENICQELLYWECHAKKSKYIATDKITLADYAFYPVLAYMVHRGLDLSEYPYLTKYYDMMTKRPSAKFARPVGWDKGVNLFHRLDRLLNPSMSTTTNYTNSHSVLINLINESGKTDEIDR